MSYLAVFEHAGSQLAVIVGLIGFSFYLKGSTHFQASTFLGNIVIVPLVLDEARRQPNHALGIRVEMSYLAVFEHTGSQFAVAVSLIGLSAYFKRLSGHNHAAGLDVITVTTVADEASRSLHRPLRVGIVTGLPIGVNPVEKVSLLVKEIFAAGNIYHLSGVILSRSIEIIAVSAHRMPALGQLAHGRTGRCGRPAGNGKGAHAAVRIALSLPVAVDVSITIYRSVAVCRSTGRCPCRNHRKKHQHCCQRNTNYSFSQMLSFVHNHIHPVS